MKYEEYTSNGATQARSPAELESDLATIRREMSDTIQRIEERFSPRALVDVAFSRARGLGENSSEFVTNLGATVRDNPVPVLLLAAGVASLFAAERRGPRPRGEQSIAEAVPGVEEGEPSAESKAAALKSKAKHLGENLSQRAGALGERAGAARTRASERASALRGRAMERGTVARERMRGAVQQARERGGRTIQEEPLVIIGTGLALGALIGASAPVTQRERSLVGRRGEHVLERTKEGIQRGVGRAKEALHGATEQLAEQTRSESGEAQPPHTPSSSAPIPDLQGGQPAQPQRGR